MTNLSSLPKKYDSSEEPWEKSIMKQVSEQDRQIYSVVIGAFAEWIWRGRAGEAPSVNNIHVTWNDK